MVEVIGKYGTSAKVLAHSICPQGIPLITYELVYPRMVHSELLTHGMLPRNAASSRAIPFAKMQEQLTARPTRFGQANPGMQDKGVDYDAPVFVHRYMAEAFKHWLVNNVPEDHHKTTWDDKCHGYFTSAENWWKFSSWLASGCAQMFHEAGYHKQVYNRLTEPFQMMKTVLSGTELANFFWLRNDSAADPTLAELARCMYEAREKSVPELLQPGEWHLPYVQSHRNFSTGKLMYCDEVFNPHDNTPAYLYYTLEDAIKVSCARTAAVSFRNEDYGLEKCLEVYARLIEGERKHASAFQHAATPMKKQVYEGDRWDFNQTDVNRSINLPSEPETWQNGVSHCDRKGQLWSAQYAGWIMHRKTIEGENYEG